MTVLDNAIMFNMGGFLINYLLLFSNDNTGAVKVVATLPSVRHMFVHVRISHILKNVTPVTYSVVSMVKLVDHTSVCAINSTRNPVLNN